MNTAELQIQVEHVMIDRSRIVNQIREAKADVYVNLCGIFLALLLFSFPANQLVSSMQMAPGMKTRLELMWYLL